VKRCIECGKPARPVLGTDDQYTDHCSNFCANVTWERYSKAASHCVGELTVDEIDERLSTTGLDVEALVGSGVEA
jgi:hypothetical protein